MIIACSDLHGNYHAFRTLKQAMGPNDYCIILGDACDRGRDGVKILLEIMEDSRFSYIVGNHDDFVLRTFCSQHVYSPKHTSEWGYRCWNCNTGPSVEEWHSLHSSNPTQFYKLLEWLANCPVYRTVYVNGTVYRLAHAHYPKMLEQLSMSWKDMEKANSDLLFSTLWDRYSENPESFVTEGCISLIGHTPQSGITEVYPTLFNLDCALGYGNNTVQVFCLDDGKIYTLEQDSLPRFNNQIREILDLMFECLVDETNHRHYKVSEVQAQNPHYFRAFGRCTDRKRGFQNATIITSPIEKIVKYDDSDTTLFVTRNSVYRRI